MHKIYLANLFKDIFGQDPIIRKIKGGGSSRGYFRMTAKGISVIGVAGEDIRENEVFINLDKCLKRSGINVPQILAVSSDKKYYLVQDLGETDLFKLLKGPQKIELSRSALVRLIELQLLNPDIWEPFVGYKPFSERLIRWDLNYFKYDFLKPSGIIFDEENLENDFDRLTAKLTGSDIYQGFMYRDFQSRNIMIADNELWFIDFQGARKGPIAYDAVSFIWQAKAPFSFMEREKLGEFYADELSKKGYDKEKVMFQLELMQIFRTLQVLGAYGFRGLIEKKAHFLESIPYGISNLNYLKEKGRLKEYPELEKITDQLNEKWLNQEKTSGGDLILKVFSFSYKKGYPDDNSGNGGGFMFDCRAIHNPGRYEEYKTKTGKDKEVIDFLERTPEADEFIDNAVKIVSPSIKRYMDRGFTSLQVGFGCTGGQHRSVYCAEKFSKLIGSKYPSLRIELIHREKDDWV